MAKKDKIIKLVKKGLDTSDIAETVDTSAGYVRKVKSTESIDSSKVTQEGNTGNTVTDSVTDSVTSESNNTGDVTKEEMEVGNPLIEQLDDDPAKIYDCKNCGCEIDYLGDDCTNDECTGMKANDWFNTGD